VIISFTVTNNGVEDLSPNLSKFICYFLRDGDT